MNIIRRAIILAIVAFSALTAIPAVAANQQGISTEQESRIREILNEGKQTTGDLVRTEAKEWSAWGRNMGSALVGLASQTGLAIEQFAKTDVGKITIVAMIFKFMGPEMVSMLSKIIAVFMVPVFTILGLYAITKMKKQHMIKQTDYQLVPVLWGLYTKRVIVSQQLDRDIEDHEAFISIILVAVYGVCLMTLLIVAFK